MNTYFDLTPIVQLAITVCAAIVTRYLIPWIIERRGRERLEKLWQYARIGVQAAEQIYGAGTGKDKAEWVRSFLAERGFTVSAAEIRAAIEAAVFEMNAAILEPVEAIGFTTGEEPADE